MTTSEAASTGVGTTAMSEGRRAVLDFVKHQGEVSADELAVAVGVTVAAVRRHLGALETEGLVSHRDERPGPGRPRRHYFLTPAAEGLWPKRYGQLTNQLLAVAEDTHPGLVDQMFDERGNQRVEHALGRLEGKSFDDRVRELSLILDEDGYLAGCEKVGPGHWRIVEHNCAILDVALRYGAACRSELSFLRRSLPDAEIERVQHMIAGAHSCSYEVRRRSKRSKRSKASNG
ncbi:MAG TPA: HTH domain-containing protein [Acidimicrobiales bacterium]|nr:HTH domain-containing protein [Acidimicrobiales bacterium]